MYLNSFSVRIEGGKEKESGYVELPHGRQYAITLRNDRSVPCDTEVTVDGKLIGEFRINAYSSIRVERPVNEEKKFTFYRAETSEAIQSGQDDIARNDRGLVQVTFKPGVPQPTVFSRGLLLGTSQVLKASNSSDGQPLGLVNVNSSDRCARNYRDETITNHANWTDTQKASRKSGITGLSGHSNQRFSEVADLPEYDSEHITQITLRLVAVSEERQDPTPLRPVAKSTPIPPPVWMLF